MRLFKRTHEDRTLTKGNVPAVMLSSVPGGVTVTPDSALRIADAYSCIRALSDAAASLPLIAYRRRAGGERERITTGRLADLLRAPAPATTQANLIGQLVCHLNTAGNAYVGKFRDDQGTVTQLGLLAPDRVQPKLVRGEPRYVFTDTEGHQTEHGTDDVLHIRAMGADGLVGLSPVQQCRAALGLSSSLVDHASAFFENDARPSGILKVANGNHEAVKALKDTWNIHHAGTANAHGIAVMSGDVEFTSVSMPLEDAQFLGQRELSAREISRIFRVPGWVINAGTGDTLTYANVTQQAEHFVRFSLQPWLTLIEQAISGDPDLSPQSVFVEFLLDNLLRGDTKERYEVYELGIRTGVLTVNEARRMENLPPRQEPATPTAAAVATNGASNA
ncbi:MAG: phage portal protein [Actinomycetota bacterium]|nr:phage portal protein [Actinomycetota bacterium]